MRQLPLQLREGNLKVIFEPDGRLVVLEEKADPEYIRREIRLDRKALEAVYLFTWQMLIEGYKPQPLVMNVKMTSKTVEYLETLAETAAYGTDAHDVAKSLIEEGIRRCIADGLLSVKL